MAGSHPPISLTSHSISPSCSVNSSYLLGGGIYPPPIIPNPPRKTPTTHTKLKNVSISPPPQICGPPRARSLEFTLSILHRVCGFRLGPQCYSARNINKTLFYAHTRELFVEFKRHKITASITVFTPILYPYLLNVIPAYIPHFDAVSLQDRIDISRRERALQFLSVQ